MLGTAMSDWCLRQHHLLTHSSVSMGLERRATKRPAD